MSWFTLPKLPDGPPPAFAQKQKPINFEKPKQKVDQQGFVVTHTPEAVHFDNSKFTGVIVESPLDEHDVYALSQVVSAWSKDTGFTQRIKNAWASGWSADRMEREGLTSKRTAAKYIKAFYAADRERPTPLRKPD